MADEVRGETGGMVISSLTHVEREALIAEGPGATTFTFTPAALAENPEPVEGEHYWVWWSDYWTIGRFRASYWVLMGISAPVEHSVVNCWRGPILKPAEPV